MDAKVNNDPSIGPKETKLETKDHSAQDSSKVPVKVSRIKIGKKGPKINKPRNSEESSITSKIRLLGGTRENSLSQSLNHLPKNQRTQQTLSTKQSSYTKLLMKILQKNLDQEFKKVRIAETKDLNQQSLRRLERLNPGGASYRLQSSYKNPNKIHTYRTQEGSGSVTKLSDSLPPIMKNLSKQTSLAKYGSTLGAQKVSRPISKISARPTATFDSHEVSKVSLATKNSYSTIERPRQSHPAHLKSLRNSATNSQVFKTVKLGKISRGDFPKAASVHPHLKTKYKLIPKDENSGVSSIVVSSSNISNLPAPQSGPQAQIKTNLSSKADFSSQNSQKPVLSKRVLRLKDDYYQEYYMPGKFQFEFLKKKEKTQEEAEDVKAPSVKDSPKKETEKSHQESASKKECSSYQESSEKSQESEEAEEEESIDKEPSKSQENILENSHKTPKEPSDLLLFSASGNTPKLDIQAQIDQEIYRNNQLINKNNHCIEIIGHLDESQEAIQQPKVYFSKLNIKSKKDLKKLPKFSKQPSKTSQGSLLKKKFY